MPRIATTPLAILLALGAPPAGQARADWVDPPLAFCRPLATSGSVARTIRRHCAASGSPVTSHGTSSARSHCHGSSATHW